MRTGMKLDRDEIIEHVENIASLASAVLFTAQLGWDLALIYWTTMVGFSVIYVLASRR